MDKLFITIVLLTALIAGYVVYDTSKDVGTEIERQSQTAGVLWNKATTTKVSVATSTSKPSSAEMTKPKKNLNGNYILAEVNGKKIEEDTYTLLVTDTKISGKICNSFFGEYTLVGNVVAVDSLASSKMACQGNPGEYENVFFKMITSKPTFVNQDGQMTLMAGNNTMVFIHVYE